MRAALIAGLSTVCLGIKFRFAGVANKEEYKPEHVNAFSLSLLAAEHPFEMAGAPHEDDEKWGNKPDVSAAGPVQRRYESFVPDRNDRNTIVSLALMCSTAYYPLVDEKRTDVDIGDRDHFGWDEAGVRGHVFASDDNSVIVIAFKGTSVVPHFAGGGIVGADKHADNMMFSCCCARVDLTWSPVCGCFRGRGQCDQQCVQQSVRSEENSYYAQSLAVFDRVRAAYPDAKAIWLTGHSLGGALASLVALSRQGMTSAVTFSSPGAVRYAQNLGLVIPSNNSIAVWNYGLTSDWIYTGKCNGPATSCYLTGYAMETTCRFGSDCTFDVDFRWQPDLSTHRISWLIKNVLLDAKNHPLPSCAPISDCVDCPSWQWV